MAECVGKAISIIEQTYLNESWLEGHVLVSEGEVTAHSIPNLFKFYPELVTCLVSVMKEDAARVSHLTAAGRCIAYWLSRIACNQLMLSLIRAFISYPLLICQIKVWREIQVPKGLSKERMWMNTSALKHYCLLLPNTVKIQWGWHRVEGLLE